jgi:assimilatory nitrate reductase electron transfer subunit
MTHPTPATRPTRVLVVGNGMAGARLAEELRHRDPSGERLAVTVVGEESHAAYNRILLSNVVAGSVTARETRLRPETWWASRGIEVRTGVRVESVDLATRTATLTRTRTATLTRTATPLLPPNAAFGVELTGMPLSSNTNAAFGAGGGAAAFGAGGGTAAVGAGGGEVIEWDELVLATGSTPFLPPLDGDVDDVVALRTLDDCERIVALAESATTAVVLGGGLLGLEAARGLLARGLDVTVVHPMDFPMERQLDADGGAVLSRLLGDLGVRILLGRVAVARHAATADDPAHVVLDDGQVVPADVAVASAGVRPRTDLARALGAEVGRGIVVDDRLATSVPRVHAVGDCVEHRGLVQGLVQPAWDQARVLADVLSGADPSASYASTPPVTRLKAHDIDLASMGDVTATVHDADHEVLSFAEPSRGRYGKLVVRDERIVGAVLLGGGPAAGALTQLFDTGAVVPRDRLSLLLGRALTSDAAPTRVNLAEMPGSTVLCRCNTVTKSAVVGAWRAGAQTVPAVAEATRATTGCGGCTSAVQGICDWLRAAEPDPRPTATPGPAAVPAALSEGAA